MLAGLQSPASLIEGNTIAGKRHMESAASKTCPECGSSELFFKAGVSSGGVYGPTLLPGLGSFFNYAAMTVVVCKDCGFIRCYASRLDRKKLDKSSEWKKLDNQ
jgi:hypothetical protein